MGKFMNGSLGKRTGRQVGKDINKILLLNGKGSFLQDLPRQAGTDDFCSCGFFTDKQSPLPVGRTVVQRSYFPGIRKRKSDPVAGSDPQKSFKIAADFPEKLFPSAGILYSSPSALPAYPAGIRKGLQPPSGRKLAVKTSGQDITGGTEYLLPGNRSPFHKSLHRPPAEGTCRKKPSAHLLHTVPGTAGFPVDQKVPSLYGSMADFTENLFSPKTKRKKKQKKQPRHKKNVFFLNRKIHSCVSGC